MILKYAGQRGLDRVALLTANYAVAAVLAALLLGMGADGGLALSAPLLGVYVWGEHLSALNKAGLGCAALALFLLNL